MMCGFERAGKSPADKLSRMSECAKVSVAKGEKTQVVCENRAGRQRTAGLW